MALWVRWLAVGILSLVLGLFALGNAVAASVAVTVVTGLFFLIAGGVQLYVGWGEQGGRRILSVALGGLMALLGFSFVANPLEGTVSLALLVTVLLAASGVVRLVLAYTLRETRAFWPLLVSGALSVLLAGVILANFAEVSTQLLGILLGVELIFNGAALVALALFLKTQTGGRG